MKTHAFIGSYTRQGGEGIYRADIDCENGRILRTRLVARAEDPSFIALHPSGCFLYAVNEVSAAGGAEGSVSAYATGQDGGGLRLINRAPSRGRSPAHLMVDAAGKHLLLANYNGPGVCVFRLASDGGVGPLVSRINHTGSGPHPTRQRTPHPHSIISAPAGTTAFVSDLGTDEVIRYDYNPGTGALSEFGIRRTRIAPYSGPRHGVFHPSGRFLYVACELSSEIAVFDYNQETGEIDGLRTAPATGRREDATRTAPAEVKTDAAGRFLYVSNRGADCISLFNINEATGDPTFVENVSTGGATPRHFALDPSGRLLLAANQDGGGLALFHIAPDTGRLRSACAEPLPAPSCVRFA
ncbi:hypothetical protein AW736_04225 [Termitidicoccus mucosus]|uniref:6-phosphogluconolactonase n=1 Tax=Termitidicoccus mucosus TaxID=1184151 RepID=A0A178IPR7_9BACT|nr:hypothetical protein AW736_04225 [Opitutaceae bacterium TSB47]